MSTQLLNNKFLKKVKFIESDTVNLNIPDVSGYYIGNFKYYKLNENGTINVLRSNNRLINVFQNDNIIGYFFEGIYDTIKKELSNVPETKVKNIGYLYYLFNNKLCAKIRASNLAGPGAYEEWEINNSKIISHYSINNNNDPEIWIGTFNKIEYSIH